MKYFYGMRLRGFSPGCQPDEGFLERLDSEMPEYYDIISYDRPLSEDDEKHYSLTPLNAVVITDNLGDDSISFFTDYNKAADHVRSTLLFAYDEYCKLYPDCNTTWTNAYLLFGDESEVYVPDSDCYTKGKIYSPIDRVKDYIKRNRYPVKIGSLEYVLIGVNKHDDVDEEERLPCANSEDKYLSFRDRYNRGINELERLTKKMSFEEAKEFFKKNATGAEAYYYGQYFYIYTKKESPEYIAFGIRMD